jgi:hypothetical protein
MKRLAMQPFRAPRQKNDKASPSRQSPRRQGTQNKEDKEVEVTEMKESEEATEMGLVWPLIIKETQCFFPAEDQIEVNRERSNITHHRIDTAASPSCSDFEAFLEKASALEVRQNKQSKTDAYWESILQSEKDRLRNENTEQTISVEDILLHESSEDDDVPIVATLQGKQDSLSLLVNAATSSISSPSLRQKKKPKVLWTYETTIEQTGAASKYWDLDAPSERATKKAAKEKLLAIKSTDDPNEGYFIQHFVFIRTLGHSHFLL